MLNHKEKVKLARRLLTPLEIENHINKFDSSGWLKHKRAIELRVAKAQGKILPEKKSEKIKITRVEDIKDKTPKLKWYQVLIQWLRETIETINRFIYAGTKRT